MIVSAIGRICPWEVAYFLVRGAPRRAIVRWKHGPVPVPLACHEAGAATDDVTAVTASVTAAAADAPTQSARRIHRLDDFIPPPCLCSTPSRSRPTHPGGITTPPGARE